MVYFWGLAGIAALILGLALWLIYAAHTTPTYNGHDDDPKWPSGSDRM